MQCRVDKENFTVKREFFFDTPFHNFLCIKLRDDLASRCICDCQISYDKVLFDLLETKYQPALSTTMMQILFKNKIRLNQIFKWIGVTTQVNSFSKYANSKAWLCARAPHCYIVHTKGQLISKAIYVVLDSPKKWTKKIWLDIS